MISSKGSLAVKLRARLQFSRHGRLCSEVGDTLVEVLITIIIISLTGLALLTAFTTIIGGSAEHRSLASNDVVLRAVTESAFSYIQQQQGAVYDPCATSPYSPPSSPSPLYPYWGAPTGYEAALMTPIQYWGASGWTSTLPPTCATTTPAQLLTMQVTAPNGTTESTQFVVDGRQTTVAPTTALSISTVTPSSLGQGALVQNLVVGGTGFVSGATVTFSNTGITVNSVKFTTSTSLTVNVSVTLTTPPGKYAISVTNPDGSTVTSANLFTVDPAPTVTEVDPTSLEQGQKNQTVTVTGTGFDPGAIVSFSASGVTGTGSTTTGSTQVQVNVNVSPTATTGVGTVTVTNSDGSNGTSAAIFTISPGVTISSTTPSPCGSSTVVDATTTCQIFGTGFDSGTTVTISANATNLSVKYVSPTEIDLTVTGSGTQPGPSDLTVTNSNGASATVVGGFVNG